MGQLFQGPEGVLPEGQRGEREKEAKHQERQVNLGYVKASFNVLGYTGFKAFRRGVPQGKDKERKGNLSSFSRKR